MTKDNENTTASKGNETKLLAARLRTLADLVEGADGIELSNWQRAKRIFWLHGLEINAKGQV